MKKKIYIVTHGEKQAGPNPGMTEQGFREVEELRLLLPDNPALVVCGTGKRHLDVHTAMGFDRQHTIWTASVGGPESLENANGQDVVLLASGLPIPRSSYTTIEDGQPALLTVLSSAPDNSVICAGRPALIMLGKSDARSAAVYRVSFEGDNPYLSYINKKLRIEEIKALGIAEAGTV